MMLLDPVVTSRDLLVTPIYLFLMVYTFRWFYRKRYKGKVVGSQYFMPAFYLRILGCFLTVAMYQYYYGIGDTFRYFRGAEELWQLFLYNPKLGIEQIFSNEVVQHEIPTEYLEIWRRKGHDVVIIQKIGGLLSLFTFKSYLTISLIISFFSFFGCWKLYQTLVDLYPKAHKGIAIACLFLPSLWFWGTGYLKDPICLGAMGLMTHSAYRIFLKREKFFVQGLVFLFSFLLILYLKIYILIAFAPALLLWLSLGVRKEIKNPNYRVLSTPVFILFFLGTGLFAMQYIGSMSKKYQVDNLLNYAAEAQVYLQKVTRQQGGSGYNIGIIEPSTAGVAKIAPKAINVSLFRPYLWEVRKPINIPAALESFFTLFLTVYVIIKVGFVRTFRHIFNDPLLLFCLTFSLVFAFAVGISSGNFGSLARYKIPLLPFYFSLWFILLSTYSNKLKKDAFIAFLEK